MTDNDIGYAEAQRYPGGIEKFLFDKVIETISRSMYNYISV